MTPRLSPLLLVPFLLLAACETERVEPVADETAPVEAVSVDLPDTTGASVWQYLQAEDYEAWPLWPDKGRLYAGAEPHGMLLTTYLNDAAYQALTGDATVMPEGAIIVKENYTPDSTLAAVTVMYKVPGYNPGHADWFFSKHEADGSLSAGPNGMPLEGRLNGCQSCHGARAGNDYLMTANLN